MLTPKQQRFVEEYLVDLNATQAAIRAGYSERTADQQGSRLLANVKVKAAIAVAVERRSEDTGITAAWALQRLKREAEYTGKGSSHAARVAALGLAMKHLGMTPEKHELSGPNGQPIQNEHSGTVEPKHALDPGAFRSFMDGVLAAGVRPVPSDGHG